MAKDARSFEGDSLDETVVGLVKFWSEEPGRDKWIEADGGAVCGDT